MGTNTLTTTGITNGQTILTSQNTQYYTAFDGDIVPRSSGAPIANGGSIGTGTYPFSDGFIDNFSINNGFIANFGDGNEGAYTSVGNFNLDGEHNYTNFTIDTGHTMTIGTNQTFLILRVNGTLTLKGNIDGSGRNAKNGYGGGTGAGGGGSLTSSGSNGTAAIFIQGYTAFTGGTGGSAGNPGTNGTDLPSYLRSFYKRSYQAFGGSPGGDGHSLIAGGNGGGALYIFAKDIVVIGSPTINLNGANGTNGTGDDGGGGGGGGGVCFIFYKTNSSGSIPTPTIAGGIGGTSASYGAGGDGGDGYQEVTQI